LTATPDQSGERVRELGLTRNGSVELRARVIELAKRADALGFSHVWTFDSHILWEEPYVIYSQILAETRNIVVGPMVTNPATRDWTVTASTFATLNEMYGNRTICGIGRGDSALRVLGKTPGMSVKQVYELFPKGPAKVAARIAGIPKPRGCI